MLASLPTPGLVEPAAAAVGVEMDVRDSDAVRVVIDGGGARRGRLDVLIASYLVVVPAVALGIATWRSTSWATGLNEALNPRAWGAARK